MARPVMSMFMLFAPPQMPLPSAKRPIVNKIAGRRPNACARPPLMGRKAVDERTYAEPTQMNWDPCRSCAMVGSAVETDATSRAERNKHVHMEAKISQNLGPLLDSVSLLLSLEVLEMNIFFVQGCPGRAFLNYRACKFSWSIVAHRRSSWQLLVPPRRPHQQVRRGRELKELAVFSN